MPRRGDSCNRVQALRECHFHVARGGVSRDAGSDKKSAIVQADELGLLCRTLFCDLPLAVGFYPAQRFAGGDIQVARAVGLLKADVADDPRAAASYQHVRPVGEFP